MTLCCQAKLARRREGVKAVAFLGHGLGALVALEVSSSSSSIDSRSSIIRRILARVHSQAATIAPPRTVSGVVAIAPMLVRGDEPTANSRLSSRPPRAQGGAKGAQRADADQWRDLWGDALVGRRRGRRSRARVKKRARRRAP